MSVQPVVTATVQAKAPIARPGVRIHLFYYTLS
jgi:hypothetical protein